jgi:hypothetical protein
VAAPLIGAKSEEKRKKKARGGIAFTDRQIAVEAAKFRVDVLFEAQPFVPVDCFLVALHRHARRLGATKPLHLFDPIVRVLQMRRRPRRLTGRRPTEVDEHDRSALSGEKGRGRHSGNARTHHADVRVDVLGQTSTRRGGSFSRPKRDGDARVVPHRELSSSKGPSNSFARGPGRRGFTALA